LYDNLKTILKKFKVYAPPDVKAYGLNADGTLTITGIASTTNKDLDGEIVTPEALRSLERQVVGLNLHLDHNHSYDGGIGVITEAEIQDNSLRITAIVLPEYANSIWQKLQLGMNMGFSIGGIPVLNSGNSSVINDFILLEVSLTLLPANWDTFGTVETKSTVESKCLTGACHYILKNKNKGDNMSKKDLNAPTEGIGDDVKQELVNIVNEALINLKPVLLDELRGELRALVQDTVSQTLVEVLPQIQEPTGMEGYEEEDIEEFDCGEPVEEKEASEEETPVEEEEAVEETEVVEEEKEATTEEEAPVEEEEVVEEEKEVTDKIPIDGIPASPEDVDYVPTQAPIKDPDYTIDAKKLADDIVSQVFKKLNMNRKKATKTTKSTGSKLDNVKKSGLKPAKKNKFLDSPKRDKFGRNRKYI